LCLSSAFSFLGSEGRPRSDIERRDDARRAGVGLRSETRGDGDGDAAGDEGLGEASDVFRDRVSGETDVVSATRLDSVATVMSCLGERPRADLLAVRQPPLARRR
jgi:hypothetical protein